MPLPIPEIIDPLEFGRWFFFWGGGTKTPPILEQSLEWYRGHIQTVLFHYLWQNTIMCLFVLFVDRQEQPSGSPAFESPRLNMPNKNYLGDP